MSGFEITFFSRKLRGAYEEQPSQFLCNSAVFHTTCRQLIEFRAFHLQYTFICITTA